MRASTQTKRPAKARRNQNRELIVRRLALGLSPNDLGRRAGLSGNTVRAAERGEYVEPRSQRAIADVLLRDGESLLVLFPFEIQRESA